MLSLRDAPPAIAVVAISLFLYRYYNVHRATRLRGPPRRNPLLGYAKELFRMAKADPLCSKWEEQYGPVFEVPSLFGTRELVLTDLKALAHFFALQTTIYRLPDGAFRTIFGPNLLTVEGDVHKMQRKVLSPAFSNSEMRKLRTIFFDCAHALENAWDAMLQDRESAVIDVQEWFNYVTLDCLGIAFFGQDFGSLKGRKPPILAPLKALLSSEDSFMILLINSFVPFAPTTKTNAALKQLRVCLDDVASKSLESARKEFEADGGRGDADRSVLRTLIALESKGSLSREDVMGQMHFMGIAGYESIAIALTWALIELCRNPDVQRRLQEELATCSDHDPTWEELMNGLPYLDAVACEVLRLHPPSGQILQQVFEDDVIPLSEPIPDADGNFIDRIHVTKGTNIRIPTATIGTSKRLWGDNGDQFFPDRWLDGSISASRANNIQGYRHLLVFSDGPRACLGRVYVLMEFKATLSILIRNYSFELPDGPDTEFQSHISLFERPKTMSCTGCKVPVIVKRSRLPKGS